MQERRRASGKELRLMEYAVLGIERSCGWPRMGATHVSAAQGTEVMLFLCMEDSHVHLTAGSFNSPSCISLLITDLVAITL